MEKNKKFNKKWLFVLGALILIAIIVITVVLCIPKNVSKVVSKAQTQEKTMFLKDNDLKFASFKAKLEKEEQILQANNVEKISNSLNVIIKHYTENLTFVKNSNVFQKNYKVLNGNLDNAKAFQEQMDKTIVKVYTTIQGTSTFVQGAWKEFYGDFKDYLNCYINVISSMSKVFDAGLNESFTYNQLSKLINTSTNNYLEVIAKTIDTKKVHVDVFSTYVNNYYTGNLTSDYVLSAALQKKVNNIQKFNSTYKSNFVELISSLTYNEGNIVSFDFKTDILEYERILIDSETFLYGGLKT